LREQRELEANADFIAQRKRRNDIIEAQNDRERRADRILFACNLEDWQKDYDKAEFKKKARLILSSAVNGMNRAIDKKCTV
jgi:hypothetical protein